MNNNMNSNMGMNNYLNQNQNQFNSSNKKTNNLLYIIVALLLVIIISVTCMLLFNDDKAKKDYTRTVMIYMVGASLETEVKAATSDIESIVYNKYKDNGVNVVFIAGGAKKWFNNYIDVNETSIYEINERGVEKVKRQDRKNMGSNEVLSDFLNYVYDNYKTDKYDLILWNHGGAIQGSEFDQLNNDDGITLDEFRKAFNASPFKGKNKLELVAFRTCLNGTIEVLNTFKDYAEYFVGSEEVTYGGAVLSVLDFINEIKMNDTGADIGKKFVSSYQNLANTIKTNAYVDDSIYSTYSVIDLSNVESLTKSINNFFNDINVNKNFNAISKVRANARQYGSSVPYYDMVDLYNLVDELKDLSNSKAEEVFKQFNNTVIYNWATNSESRGISIYFPYNGKSEFKTYSLNIYNSFNELNDYYKFIKSFNSAKESGYKSSFAYSTSTPMIEKKESDADFKLVLNDTELNNFASAKYYVYRDNKDGYYKPIYMNGKAVLNGNELIANIRGKQLIVSSITNSNDNYNLLLNEVDESENYLKYETNVILQSFKDGINMVNGTINLLLDKNSKKIDVLSTVINTDNLPASAVADLSEYDSVAFSIVSGWTILDEKGNYVGPITENGKIKGDGIITGWEEKVNNYKFDLSNFDDGYDYYCVFAINDVYGNTTYSKLVKMN